MLPSDKTPPLPEGVFPWAQLGALAIVVVALVLLCVLARLRKPRPGHGGLVTGADNRYSTGRIVVLAWTVVVGWMVVTESVIANMKNTTSFAHLLGNASDLYFVLLGAPYAAAALALLSTQTKLAQGTLIKAPATDGPSAADVVSDDNGNVDTVDLQYVFFNALALAIVVLTFVHHPALGLPEIPQFLAILTGGAALTYTVNKAVAAGGPTITSVMPINACIGDTVTIVGTSLYSAQAGDPRPTVTIGGIAATAVTIPLGATGTLTAVVAGPPAGSMDLTGPVDVVVASPLKTPITLAGGVTIVADKPSVDAVWPVPAVAEGLLTVTGALLLAPGTEGGTATAGTTTIGGLTATLIALEDDDPNAALAAHAQIPVTFEGVYTRDSVTLRLAERPSKLLVEEVGKTAKVTLTLSRDGVAAGTSQLDFLVPSPPA